jgi:hypothetical protein
MGHPRFEYATGKGLDVAASLGRIGQDVTKLFDGTVQTGIEVNESVCGTAYRFGKRTQAAGVGGLSRLWRIRGDAAVLLHLAMRIRTWPGATLENG